MTGAKFSMECYFERAMRWRPEDPVVRMVYANHLAKRGEVEGAREQYEAALKLDPDGPEIAYNAGLFYFSQKQYSRARELAETAYKGGYPLPGLKNKLKGVGQWSGT
jgi:Flp pilus assembly protein TadD